MKKILLMAVISLGFAAAAYAQPRAIGLRGGLKSVEASYQHTLNENFIEGNLGLAIGGGFGLNAAGTYNFMIAQPEWTDRGEWGFYAGPGVGLGFGFGNTGGDVEDGRSIKRSGDTVGYFTLGVLGQAGLEYTFWFPLQLSVDVRPMLSLNMGNTGVHFNASGLIYGFVPTLSVRYRF